jgi:hypothetical protein
VRRTGEERTLLFVDHADNIARATQNHPLWAEALRLGFNELNVNTWAGERIDRLLLRGRIVRRCGPLLNLLDEDEASWREDKARVSAG